MIIRAAQLSDVPAMATVHVRSWQKHYAGIMDQNFLDTLDINARIERWNKAIGDPNNPNTNLVGLVNNEVVGFVSVGPSRKDFYPGWGELLALYLATDQQKKGYGRKLFDEGRAILKKANYSHFYLWVLEKNPTRGFYERVGGKLGRSDIIEIGNQKLNEVSYEWDL